MLDCSQKLHHWGLLPLASSLLTGQLGSGDRMREAAAHLCFCCPSPLAGRAAQICSRDFKCCHPAFNPCLTASLFPGQKESFSRRGYMAYRTGEQTARVAIHDWSTPECGCAPQEPAPARGHYKSAFGLGRFGRVPGVPDYHFLVSQGVGG